MPATNPWTGLLGEDWLNTDLGAGFNSVFGGAQRGATNRNYANWLGNQQNPYEEEFKAAIAQDPNLTWTQFLKTKNPMTAFQSLAPQLRGENQGQYAPRLKFMSLFGS